jgi:hypothetical protein
MFGGMGVLIFTLLRPWRLDPTRDGWTPILIIAGLCLALWSVPLLLLRRLVRALGARADLRRGTLRQGVFLGPEGMLVRMEGSGAHPIAADRFVGARRFPPEESRDGRKPTLVIETLDGSVEFFAERLGAGARDIQQAAREVWPSWRPSPRLPKDRKKQPDVQTRRKTLQAAYVFAGAMLLVLAGLGAVVASGGGSRAADWFSLVVFLALVAVAASVVNLFYRLWVLKVSYRCPQCRGRPVRVFEALPDVHFYCRACNVEWETGLKELADQD